MWTTMIALILLINRHSWAADDFVAKRVFLKTPASFVNLSSEAWRVHDQDEEITMAVRFQSNTKVGQVFSLRAIGQHGMKIVKLVGSLHNGYLQIDLFNKDGHSVLNKPLRTHFLGQHEEHSLAIRINTSTSTLAYRLEPSSDHECEITEIFDFLDAELVPTLGGGGNSMIGCVTLVTVQVGGSTPPYVVIPIASNEIDECSDEHECAYRDCHKGRCLPLEVATCDCYGTNMTGPNCRQPARSVFVLNNDDENQPSTILYTPWKVDQVISRITIDFRFGELDNKQGVILHAVLEDDSVVKLFVVEGNGNLLFGSHGHLNFTLVSSKVFHSIFIGIHHESHTIGLSVDDQIQKLVLPADKVDLRMVSLLFGGAPPTDEARELGITACLRNIYVDHHDIINMLYNNDNRVIASRRLAPCNRDGSLPDLFAIGQPLFEAEPVPNVFSEPLSEHGITDTGEMAVKGNGKEDSVSETSDGGGEAEHKAGLFTAVQKNGSLHPLPCEKSQDYVCRNDAECERRSGSVVCICKSGFGGKYCQFVLHPRTCAEANAFHALPSGPTWLDVDGSQQLYGSVAVCRNGTTIVPHDMPVNTVVRSSGTPTDTLYVVSYRDFTIEKLVRLIKNSGCCKQQVHYVCDSAALGFESRRTWFHVAVANRTVSQIGRVPNSCPCMDTGCVGNNKCNCDSGASSNDSGSLYDEDAGIVRVVALYTEGDVDGKITIGPLECEGFAASAPLRFAEPRALPVRYWHGQSLSLQFRTAVSSGTIFAVQESDKKYLRVELVHGHTIRARFANSSATVESQARLNDTKWHLLLLEIDFEEIRLSVDGLNSFASIEKSAIPKGKLLLNDDESGFTGCVRSIMLNEQPIDVRTIGSSVEGVFHDCDDRCDATKCRNFAECLEDFASNSVVCRCRHPTVQSGQNCENDINQNSSVSFHGGFLKYELSENALVDQTVLSFRTDQSQALIMFVHDQNNNFMQLHLSEEVNLTLSLNNEDVVSYCTVRARSGTEFGDMEWVQVTIEHLPDSSTLTVNDDACSINTPRKLAVHPIQKFNNFFTDVVIIPVGLNSPADPKPFLYTFIGGVERESQRADGSMLLRPIYQSVVPNLLGCIRGFRVDGEVVNLRNDGLRPNDSGLVRVGCDMGCSELDCKNGGHCSVAWLGDGHTACECSRTSYFGSDCTDDQGLTFASNGYFTFDLERFLSRYIIPPVKRPPQTLQFAFAPASPSTAHQTLATVLFNDDRLFEVILNRNGSLNVGIVDEIKKTVIRTFAGNFSDGYRHFFVARFGSYRTTSVTVDAIRQDFDFVPENLDLYNAIEITLGGQGIESDEQNTLAAKTYYNGCISNLYVDFGVPALHVSPISYLYNSAPSTTNYSRISAAVNVTRGACAPFRVHNALPVFYNPVELPVWETNFKRLVYHDANSEDNTGEEGKFWLWTLGIVTSLVLFLLLATVLVCCCLIICGMLNEKTSLPKGEEQQSLRVSLPSEPALCIDCESLDNPIRETMSDPFIRNQHEPMDSNIELSQMRAASPLAPLANIEEAEQPLVTANGV